MAKHFARNAKNELDPGFSVRVDTVYYGKHPFTGVKFSLYANGDTAAISPYYEGLAEGWTRQWHPNRKLALERFYIGGRKEGIHRAWWPNGKPKFRYTFDNDEFNGENREWYENGAPFKVFHYAQGHEEGSQKMYWINGKVRANYIIKNKRRYGLLGTKNCVNVADSVFIER
ncbi:MAG: hypothetical protein REI78_12190 [Pedobacter sp.]|nr:hypothetical protein [Pedobacter sp.]